MDLFNPNQIWDFVTTTLADRHPLFIAWLAGTAGVVGLVTQAVKKWKPALDGNRVQMIAGGVALVASAVYAALGGVFKDGFQGNDLEGIVLLAVASWLMSMGGYSLATNRNDRPPAPLTTAPEKPLVPLPSPTAPTQDETQAAIDKIKQATGTQ